ncbi:MAG: recombination mediator RecR [Mucinivorans sp.]
MSQLLDNAVTELSKLPGVGRRTALRLALHLLRRDVQEVDLLSGALYEFRRSVRYCSRCRNLSDSDLCPICSDTRRNQTVVCVVENVGDLISIESTGQYEGLYHVLGGIISPIEGITPSELGIDLLEQNIRRGVVQEVILALPTTTEGETTAYYITRRLQGLNIKISAISRGIGFGDQIEYADTMTITHALRNRSQVL